MSLTNLPVNEDIYSPTMPAINASTMNQWNTDPIRIYISRSNIQYAANISPSITQKECLAQYPPWIPPLQHIPYQLSTSQCAILSAAKFAHSSPAPGPSHLLPRQPLVAHPLLAQSPRPPILIRRLDPHDLANSTRGVKLTPPRVFSVHSRIMRAGWMP